MLAGFLVALKQILPNLELPMCFFWKIKAKVCISLHLSVLQFVATQLFCLVIMKYSWNFQWMPLFVIVFSTVMAFIVVESINFLPTLVAGTYVGWIYLRYFQKNPLTGLKGDPSDDFSFASFFPDFMRY